MQRKHYPTQKKPAPKKPEPAPTVDFELAAIEVAWEALRTLSSSGRDRALDYLVARCKSQAGACGLPGWTCTVTEQKV